MSAVPSSGWLYGAIQRGRNRGLGGLYLVVAAFLVLYAVLFPGILSVGGFSKFTQNWFPLALVTMAQALLMLNGGITLAIGPLVSLGAVIAATTMGSVFGVPGGILAVALTGLAIGAVIGA
ncbi:MAG: ABC transporter permease, partial [Proteobacteria bacterium]|nr:ABC transporter permease [Pseudomonadota bacterium]